jgi:hypothetical protein
VSDWHLGQRGRAAAQGDRVCADEPGKHPSYGIRQDPYLAVTMGICRLGSAARWSILLTFEKVDGMTASQTIDGDRGMRDCDAPNPNKFRSGQYGSLSSLILHSEQN